MKCGDCIYFVEHGCRRYPPTLTTVSDPDHEVLPCVGFPTVEVTDWCGEFKSNAVNH